MTAGSPRLLREGGVKTLATAVVGVMGLLSSIVLARVLSEDALGLFVLVLAVVQVGVMIADGGSGLAATRYVAAAPDDGAARRVGAHAMQVRLMTTAGTLALFLLLWPIFSNRMFSGALENGIQAAVALWILGKSAFLFVPAILRGHRDWTREGVLLGVEGMGILGVYSSILWWPAEGLALVARMAGLYGVLVLTAVVVLRGSPRHAASREPETTVGRLGLLRFGLPLLMNSSLFLALTWTDRLLIGTLRTHEELAHYFVAVGLITAARMVVSVPEQVFYSHLAQTTRPGDPSLARVHGEVFVVFAGLALVMLALGGIAGRALVPLIYGAPYVASVWPFQFLLLVLMVRVISIPASLILVVVFERTQEARNALAIAFVVNLGLNLVLIPDHGVQGAIVASLAGFVLATAYLWYALWRTASLRVPTRDLVTLVALATPWFLSTAAEHLGWIPEAAFWSVQIVVVAAVAVVGWLRVRPVLAHRRTEVAS